MGREKQIINERLRKIKELKEKGINPYSYKFNKKQNISQCLKSKLKTKVKTAGRLMTKRDIGKIIFCKIQDQTGEIQIVFQDKETPVKDFDFFKKYIDLGDFIGIKGEIIKTKTGEHSILVNKIELLTKSISPLPEKWHGLQDKEERYRKRYLDLVMNPKIRDIFIKRNIIIESIREFLKKRDYVEVQTPILQPIYGGANARPFESKLNALNIKLYLRISNELYLKRLIAGGFDKIFEFSTNFRNEGIDRSHNPEFSLFEAMTSYEDYNDGMDLIEEITEYIVKKVNGTTKINYQGKNIDFKRPWKRISMRDALIKYANIDIEKTDDKRLKKILNENKIKLNGEYERGNAIMALVEEFCEKHFIQPTILYDYPVETSPLAKQKRDNPKYAERFEQYVNGFEIGNNYSELNDPQILAENWKKQEQTLKKGDDEAQRMDSDFINALEVGMPPTCGIAISIDRITMILTDQSSIRDVILFPFMKPKGDKK
jgi:lysyl-tRNA synthetase class 2|tara:strand:- start:9506 stop:10966 length:1461 start_codon:yes stop_codon:yes gene_type:complete